MAKKLSFSNDIDVDYGRVESKMAEIEQRISKLTEKKFVKESKKGEAEIGKIRNEINYLQGQVEMFYPDETVGKDWLKRLEKLDNKVQSIDDKHKDLTGYKEEDTIDMYDKEASPEEVYEAAKARYEKRSFFRKALDKIAGKSFDKGTYEKVGRDVGNDLYR